jgi:hypothetical protein
MAKRKRSRRADLDTQSNHAMPQPSREPETERDDAMARSNARVFCQFFRQQCQERNDRNPAQWGSVARSAPIEFMAAATLGRNVSDFVDRALQIDRDRCQPQCLGARDAAHQIMPQLPQCRATRRVFDLKQLIDHRNVPQSKLYRSTKYTDVMRSAGSNIESVIIDPDYS